MRRCRDCCARARPFARASLAGADPGGGLAGCFHPQPRLRGDRGHAVHAHALDRGAEALAAAGAVTSATAEALKEEARRRVEAPSSAISPTQARSRASLP